jgi:hypothetical protein
MRAVLRKDRLPVGRRKRCGDLRKIEPMQHFSQGIKGYRCGPTVRYAGPARVGIVVAHH